MTVYDIDKQRSYKRCKYWQSSARSNRLHRKKNDHYTGWLSVTGGVRGYTAWSYFIPHCRRWRLLCRHIDCFTSCRQPSMPPVAIRQSPKAVGRWNQVIIFSSQRNRRSRFSFDAFKLGDRHSYVLSLATTLKIGIIHDDVIKWKHFPRNWPFVRGIHRSPVNSPHKGQWRGALMFSLNCVWINDWVNNGEAGDLRRHCIHYDVTVMISDDSHKNQVKIYIHTGLLTCGCLVTWCCY